MTVSGSCSSCSGGSATTKASPQVRSAEVAADSARRAATAANTAAAAAARQAAEQRGGIDVTA